MSDRAHLLAAVDLHFQDGVVLARQRGREVAKLLGFDHSTQIRIATAVSELARNAHRYAGGGEVTFGVADGSLTIEVADQGPGITDLDAVMSGSYESNTGLGQGLIGVRRLMDSFEISSSAAGTRVRTSKQLPDQHPVPPQRARELRLDLARRASSSAYEEVQEQNQELLQALSELRSRQDELVHLNVELEDTNRGVVALYAELDERAEQLRDADGRKSRFLADMSHELRTPLNSIVALADLLAEGSDPLTAEQRTQIQYIRRMAIDQLQLVGELLDLAKIEAGRIDLELRALSVAELFASLRPQLRPLVAGSPVDLRFSYEPGLPPLATDERKLVQIMRNLVSNAVKYTNEGEVLVSASNIDDHLELAVQDTGIGIPEEALERIFDEFVQVQGEHQRGRQGTGLGLPLTRKLAEVLGGSVTVESVVGQGSRFVLRLPWRTPHLDTAGRTDEAAVRPPVLDLVLVADDDEPSRYVVRRELETEVREIAEVDGGASVLAFVYRRRPSAIVLDLTMPDLDGFEVLRHLRATPGLDTLPVVVHTSRELGPEERERLANARAVVVDKSSATRRRLMAALSEASELGDG
jgi:signal transduction histidine kinase